jgi:uncharacterized damage-inducible protein DinB
MSDVEILRQHLVSLLNEGNAHATFDQAIENLPAELRGRVPEGAPHSPWQLLEHLRLAQEDILDFSRNPEYQERKWPEDYWPKSPVPPSDASWEESVSAFHSDLQQMSDLVQDPATDLFARIPHGSGQTILREAMLVADHNAYHVGQLVLVRQLLGAWK